MNWYYVSGQEWGGGLESFFADVLHEWPRVVRVFPPSLSLLEGCIAWLVRRKSGKEGGPLF